MPSSNSANSLLQATGIIQHLDIVNRELGVRVGDSTFSFDIPPDCAVILNGEPVKLRLLQPMDCVAVFYLAGPRGLRTARRVIARPGQVQSISSSEAESVGDGEKPPSSNSIEKPENF